MTKNIDKNISEFTEDFTFASISIVATNPLNVIKTHKQLHGGKHSFHKICSNIYKQNNIKGFFAGTISGIFTKPPFWAIYFQTNNYLNELDNEIFNFNEHNIARAYTAACITSTLLNPLFVLNTRMQANTFNKTYSYYNTIINIGKNEGYSTFCRGVPATLLNNMKLGIQMPMYEYLKEYLKEYFIEEYSKGYSIDNRDRVPTTTLAMISIISSLTSKLTSTCLLYPLDLLRTHQRTSKHNITLRQAYHNLRASKQNMYSGVLVYSAVSTLQFVIMMLCKELITIQPTINNILDKYELE